MYKLKKKRLPRSAPSTPPPSTATCRETQTLPTSIFGSAAVERRPRGTFLLQLDEKRALYPPEQGLPRGGGLCPLPRPARAFALNHASCPGYFLPCFSIFALPRRTLKGGQGGTIVGSPCFFRFLSSEKGRIYKKANFVLVQTRLETSTLLSTCKNVFLSKPKQK